VDRKRLLRLLLLAAGLAVVLVLGRRWPKEQTVHYVLGDAASRVQEVDARWAEFRTLERSERADSNENAVAASGDDWTREATFRYAPGQAPRIVTHEPKLPDGDYTVEIDIVAASEKSPEVSPQASRQPEGRTIRVRKRVTLAGGSTSIDLAQAVPR
jgi:nucleoid-associated protein YgaU